MKNNITNGFIVAVATLIAAMTWSGINNLLYENGFWLWPVLGLFLWLVLFCISWVMSKTMSFIIITLGTIFASYFLTFGFKVEQIIVIPIAFALLSFGSFQAMKEKQARVKISGVKIFKSGLPWVLTGLCLLIAMAYYFSPLAFSGNNRIEIPRSLFDIFIEPATTMVNGATTGFVANIPAPYRPNLNLEVDEQFKDSTYQTINEAVNKKTEPFRNYLSLGLTIGFFLVLKTLSLPFGWLVVFFSWIIFKLLMGSGAIKKEERSVLQEII